MHGVTQLLRKKIKQQNFDDFDKEPWKAELNPFLHKRYGWEGDINEQTLEWLCFQIKSSLIILKRMKNTIWNLQRGYKNN